MLTRFFASADRDVERFSAWLEKLGPSGTVVTALMLWGVYCAVDLARYVIAHQH
jgi:hypothetical protein